MMVCIPIARPSDSITRLSKTTKHAPPVHQPDDAGKKGSPMKSSRGGRTRFLVHAVDRRGRAIDAAVLTVAEEVGPRAVAYADRLLVDTALALDLFEEAAASVTEAMKRKPADAPPVRDLAAYLYRTFLRKVNLARSKHVRIENSLRNKVRIEHQQTRSLEPEISLLFDEVMATYDRVTRDIIYRRLEGFSWKEIGTEFGILPHAAETRFSRALARARLLLGIRRTKS